MSGQNASLETMAAFLVRVWASLSRFLLSSCAGWSCRVGLDAVAWLMSELALVFLLRLGVCSVVVSDSKQVCFEGGVRRRSRVGSGTRLWMVGICGGSTRGSSYVSAELLFVSY